MADLKAFAEQLVSLTVKEVNELAKMRADDNNLRLTTLGKIRKLAIDHPEIEIFGYHDIEEFKLYKN